MKVLTIHNHNSQKQSQKKKLTHTKYITTVLKIQKNQTISHKNHYFLADSFFKTASS